jgi:hypothetical protein
MRLGPCDSITGLNKWHCEPSHLAPWMTHNPDSLDVLLTLHLQVYPAGSVHHLRRGEVKQYKMHRGCFALEYAVGESYLSWLPCIRTDVMLHRLDTTYAAVWVCGYPHVNVGRPNPIPHRQDHCKGDD